MSSKSVSQIFKIIFQTGDININIFVHCGVFFSGYVQLKSSFSDKNNISGKIWDSLQQRSYRKLTWQSIKGKLHHWQKLELCKVVHNVKNYTDNANGGLLLRILTGKKYRQIKHKRLQKIQIWAFELLVQQINSLSEVLKLKQNFQKK